MYDAENVEFKFSRLRRHLKASHTMQLVVRNPFQIHCFLNHLYGFSIIVQTNRMVQIASCVPTFKFTQSSTQSGNLTLSDMGGGGIRLNGELSSITLKATFHLTISMRGQRATGKIQRNNYNHGSCGPPLTCKTTSVFLIFTQGTHRNVKNR